MTRKIVLASLSVVIILGAIMVAKDTIANKKEWNPKIEKKLVTGVFVEKVKNISSPITITTSGNLTAKNRVELYAEVQGIFNRSSRSFKPGTWYRRGETLLQLDKKEEDNCLKSAEK